MLRWWRNGPEFSQRYTFSNDGDTITSQGEMSKNAAAWEPDLNLIYQHLNSVISRLASAVTAGAGSLPLPRLLNKSEPFKRPLKKGVDQSAKPAETGYAAINGLQLYYEVHGQGQPLVLLHGSFMTIPLNWTHFLRQRVDSQEQLREQGWQVLTVWECELRKSELGATLHRLTRNITALDDLLLE